MASCRSSFRSLLAGLLCLCIASGPLQAEEASELRKAEALATEATVFFRAGLYDKAAGKFMEAWAVSKRPALMFNAARAYEQANEAQAALALFRHYGTLPGVPDDGRRDAAAHIGKLEELLRQQERERQRRLTPSEPPRSPVVVQPNEPELPVAPTATVVAPAWHPLPPPSTNVTRRPAPAAWAKWSLAGGGTLLVAAGGMFVVARSEADAARGQEPVQSQAAVTAYLEHADAARVWRGASVGSLILGLAASGVGLWQLWQQPPPSTVAVAPPTNEEP